MSQSKPKLVQQYKNYRMWKLGRFMVAVPNESTCYARRMEVGESNDFACEQLIKLTQNEK